MTQGQEQEKKLTTKDYVFLVSQGVSNTVLVFLGIGLLVNTVGTTIHWDALVQVGDIAQKLLAPALGMAIAVMMRTSTLVIGSTMIASTLVLIAFTLHLMWPLTRRQPLVGSPLKKLVRKL